MLLSRLKLFLEDVQLILSNQSEPNKDSVFLLNYQFFLYDAFNSASIKSGFIGHYIKWHASIMALLGHSDSCFRSAWLYTVLYYFILIFFIPEPT